MSDIYEEIRAERQYQRNRWGDDTDDTKNTPWMWVAYIAQQATRWMRGEFLPLKTESSDLFRVAMIKTAATAVAAIESLDRQRTGGSGTPFYERPFSGITYQFDADDQGRDNRNGTV